MTETAPALPFQSPRRGLALRYRPRRFAELTGQRHAAAILGRMVARGDVPRQVLLSGGSGLGKTTVGRILASALLCETPTADRADGDACGTCPSCRDVTADVPAHPDVIEMDAASNGGKDEIRDIAAKAALAPVRGNFKIYVIDEVHAITGAGGQAFLKLLEEPPAHVVFVLCTTNPEKLSSGAGGAGTIRGRCLELELVRPSDAELTANLSRIAQAEAFALDADIAAQVIVATDPTLGVRGTVMTLEKLAARLADTPGPDADEVATLLGTVSTSRLSQLTDAIGNGDRAAALTALDLLRARASDQTVRTALLRWARDVLRDALAGAGPVGADVALARFELLAGLPAASHWTDVAVVKMARPATDGSQAAAVVADAEDVLARLTAEVATARKAVEVMRTAAAPGAPVPPPAADAPATPAGPDFGAPAGPDFGATTPPGDDRAPLPDDDVAPWPDEPPMPDDEGELPPPVDAPAGPPSRGAPRKASPATPGRGRAPGSEAKVSPKLRSLINRVATLDPPAARLLAECDVTFKSGRVSITPPDAATGGQLSDASRQRLLHDAAQKVGMRRVTVEQV